MGRTYRRRRLGAAGKEGTMKVSDFIGLVKSKVGVEWRERTVDVLLEGDPGAEITGIAVSMMATQDVLQAAVDRGANLVVTHEPLYYDHHNKIETLREDPLYLEKRSFISQKGLNVFHFHDHWHGMKVDGIAKGMALALDWVQYSSDTSFRRFSFPGRTLGELVLELKRKLGAQTLRYVGDDALEADNLSVSWGYVERDNGIRLLNAEDRTILLVGETREWELVEYAYDARCFGLPKALVVLGHIPSEEAGMEYCADWIRSFAGAVPVQFVKNGDPFRRRPFS